MFAVPIEVVSDTVAESNVTIELQSGNFMSNLTITYGPCSEASHPTLKFRSPVVHLNNLTADTLYCYSISYNESNATVADDKAVVITCNGTFITAADTGIPCTTIN